MHKIEKVELLRSKRDYLYLLLLFLILFLFSLFREYYHYKELTKFDSQLVHATVIKQYTKKKHQVLKLKSSDGFSFYTTAPLNLANCKDKELEMEIWAGKISFLSYLKGFFAFSKILNIQENLSLKTKIDDFLADTHSNKDASALYQALYLAKPLPYHLQQSFANLGISHLIAISGFHLGVLSTLLFFLLKYPYRILQNNYFPYRDFKRDSFFIISLFLLAYLLFLDTPSSVLRAFAMLVIGFFLYDKGIKIISMQTLLITLLLLVSLFPRLLFSIGFFLSLSGVFYIFLFLHHFQTKSKIWHFLLLPLWLYLTMLPYSLVLFGNFSLYHPLSVLITLIFTLFYPLSIFMHLISFGDLLDGLIEMLLMINPHSVKIKLPNIILYIGILFSLVAVFKKEALYLLLVYCFSVFIYSIYYIA